MGKAKKKKQAKEKAEPLDDRFIKVMRFSSDIGLIAEYLGDQEQVTVGSLRRGKFTKEELVEDIKHVWDRINKAKQETRQLRIHLQKFQPGTLKDVSITLNMLCGPIDSALWEFDLLNWPADKELFYKHTQRAYRKANEYRHRLELLSSKLADDAETELVGKEESKAIEADDLTDYESNIIEALGNQTLGGKEIAQKLKQDYSGYFRGNLSHLRKRGILGNNKDGYFIKHRACPDK